MPNRSYSQYEPRAANSVSCEKSKIVPENKENRMSYKRSSDRYSSGLVH